jgi:hypothetical protein
MTYVLLKVGEALHLSGAEALLAAAVLSEAASHEMSLLSLRDQLDLWNAETGFVDFTARGGEGSPRCQSVDW